MFTSRSSIRTAQSVRPIAHAVRATLDMLEPRQLLANDPLTVGTYKVGTAVWLNVVGSGNDDAIVVTQTAKTTYSITNGTWTLSKTGTFVGVRVLAGVGNDSVTISGVWATRTSVMGEAGDDTLSGGIGIDALNGGIGNDAIYGNAGNDNLYGDIGDDTLSGGAGNDSLNGVAGNDSLTGGEGNDSLTGDAGNDTMLGGAGNDLFNAGAGDDSLDGGDGNDNMSAVDGNDTLLGGLGNDVMNAGNGDDSMDGGDGNDNMLGVVGNDTMVGGLGNDSMNGGLGNDQVTGNDGNDTLVGDAGNDTLLGGNGNDWLGGYAGDDSVNGGANDDRLVAATDTGNDIYVGGSGLDSVDYTGRLVGLTITLDGNANDGATGETDNVGSDLESIIGGNAADSITSDDNARALYGQAGNDTIIGGGAADKIFGGAGNDSLVGGVGADSLWGQDGNDVMLGGDDEDLLEGGAGNDAYNGGDGDDHLIAIGGGVADSLTGGAGLDSFWLDSNITETVVDVETEETAAAAVHRVGAFVKYGATVVSKEITGQKLAEPTPTAPPPGYAAAKVYNFAKNKLFADAGPSEDDLQQGYTGDCWFMSTLSAIAKVSAETIRQAITDLGDGTYAARFYNPANHAEQYVRVDADLYTYSFSATTQMYARTGTEGSIWAPLMEKALTWVRGGKLGNYNSIAGGLINEGSARLGITSITTSPGATGSVNSMVDWLHTQLDAGKAITIGTPRPVQAGVRLVESHAYVVDHMVDNNDGTFSFVLRNPWGSDGVGSDGANDGYVTIPAAQLYANCTGMSAAAA